MHLGMALKIKSDLDILITTFSKHSINTPLDRKDCGLGASVWREIMVCLRHNLVVFKWLSGDAAKGVIALLLCLHCF